MSYHIQPCIAILDATSEDLGEPLAPLVDEPQIEYERRVVGDYRGEEQGE